MLSPLLLTTTSPIAALLALKAHRTTREWRASRNGFVTLGGDDKYQARNVHLNRHDACMVARIRLDMPLDEFDRLTDRVRTNFLPWFAALERCIEHRPAAFETPFEVAEHYAPHELGETRVLCKMQFFRQDRTIVLFGDHTYLGGYQLSQFVQLVFCESVTRGIFPRNPYLPVISEAMMLGFLARTATRPRHEPAPTFPQIASIERLYWKTPHERVRALADELGMNVLYVTIALHIDLVMRRMNRKHLRVTLPVSFESESTFNTVGAVFLELDAQPDLATLARVVRREIKRRQWHVSASNHIQRVFPTREMSQHARNTVDFTLTVVPPKTLPHHVMGQSLRDYEFTMDNIEYPVYAMAFLFEDHLHSSLMINTPDFDVVGACSEDGARRSDLSLSRRAAAGSAAADGAPGGR
ncbi:MAG: hypothetical protein H6698_02010 [Myxococcales bacterium]|nr:hypothetical protein [Myxococcales bacterium]